MGATPNGGQTDFVVWAPNCRVVHIDIVSPMRQRIRLQRGDRDYFSGRASVGAGARYFVVPDDDAGKPDPASRYQPEGVHGPSEVIDSAFVWNDHDWRGLPLERYVIYELHVGTFSPESTFDGAIAHLDELVQLGITAIELMPVAQFPGTRNWGYDGVQPFAVQNSYGGPAGLKRLVDACHTRGLAVVLDVVYNHLGPEGNYLGEFAPYFTHKYKTPWGPAVNVDERHSDEVRRFFIDNALEWIIDYHIDALRLDAVHGILDTSAQPFLAELSQVVEQRANELGRQVHLIAESDLNDVRMLLPTSEHGMGMHAQWADDFHHALHSLLTRERDGYYADFGSVHHLAEALRHCFIYRGQYSNYRARRHGNDPSGASDAQFCVCMQNHDQVGNRMNGDRISTLIDREKYKVGAAAVLLSPYVPLLFMGEEYSETQPFAYFIDHSDKALVEAVRRGRREEFAAFAWQAEPPDPHAQDTFENARLRRPGTEPHKSMRAYYRRLLELRDRHHLNSGAWQNRRVEAHDAAEAVTMVSHDVALVLAFGEQPATLCGALPAGRWCLELSSRAHTWQGPGDDAPAQIESSGRVQLTLPGPVARFYTRVR